MGNYVYEIYRVINEYMFYSEKLVGVINLYFLIVIESILFN